MITLPIEFVSETKNVQVYKVYNCWDCKDTGEIEKYTFDRDHGVSIWDGYRPCICRK